MQSVCETLPAAIPSLVLCLQTLMNFDQSETTVFARTMELTKCNYSKSQTGFMVDPSTALSEYINYNIDDIMNIYKCEFPGASMYTWLLGVKLTTQFFQDRHERYSNILNEYNLKHNFFNSMVFLDAKSFYKTFEELLTVGCLNIAIYTIYSVQVDYF